MAEKKGSEKTETETQARKGGKLKLGLPLVLTLAHTVAAVAVTGLAAYVFLIYKRPPITEEGEREKVAMLKASPRPPPAPGYLKFDPISVNITPVPATPRPADGTTQQLQGKLHYATVAFTLEIRDTSRQEEVEALRPIIVDNLLAMVGKRTFYELVTVQGRYVLRTQIQDSTNRLLAASRPGTEPLVTNVFFTEFTVQ